MVHSLVAHHELEQDLRSHLAENFSVDQSELKPETLLKEYVQDPMEALQLRFRLQEWLQRHAGKSASLTPGELLHALLPDRVPEHVRDAPLHTPIEGTYRAIEGDQRLTDGRLIEVMLQKVQQCARTGGSAADHPAILEGALL